jgi:hypothetical protein
MLAFDRVSVIMVLVAALTADSHFGGQLFMPTLHQTTPHGVFYSLSQDEHLGEDPGKRYNGCGNGFIVVEKATDRVVEMSYAADGTTIERQQNLFSCDDAGKVLREDDEHIVYRANFSCWSACLF